MKITIIKIFIFFWLFSSFLSFHLLPSMPIYGADLSMQFYFHKCTTFLASNQSIYTITGQSCGDLINLFYAYPPLIFRFFSFAKLFTDFKYFYYFYTSLSAFFIFSIPFFFKKYFKEIPNQIYYILGFILLIQAPSFYAFERGGTDLIFTMTWLIAILLFSEERFILSAILMCLSVLLKLYPAIALLPIIFSFLYSSNYKSKNFIFFSLTGIITASICFLTDLNLWKDFLIIALPKTNSMPIGTNAIGHSLIGPFNKFFVYALLIYFIFIFSKIISHQNKKIKIIGLLSTLGFSTFFSNHSFDYNLITLYPLITYLILTSYKKFKLDALSLALIFFTLTVLGPANFLFGEYKYSIKLKLLIEIAAFYLIYFGITKSKIFYQED